MIIKLRKIFIKSEEFLKWLLLRKDLFLNDFTNDLTNEFYFTEM